MTDEQAWEEYQKADQALEETRGKLDRLIRQSHSSELGKRPERVISQAFIQELSSAEADFLEKQRAYNAAFKAWREIRFG